MAIAAAYGLAAAKAAYGQGGTPPFSLAAGTLIPQFLRMLAAAACTAVLEAPPGGKVSGIVGMGGNGGGAARD